VSRIACCLIVYCIAFSFHDHIKMTVVNLPLISLVLSVMFSTMFALTQHTVLFKVASTHKELSCLYSVKDGGDHSILYWVIVVLQLLHCRVLLKLCLNLQVDLVFRNMSSP